MLTINDNGSEAIAIINAALENAGSEVSIGNENGQSVATKLNGVFGDTLITSSLSGSAFAQAVEDGFESLDGGGDTPIPEPDDDHIKMRFLHISDTHGTTVALEQVRDMLVDDDDIEAVIVSGDFCPYNSKSQARPHSDGTTPAYYDGETLAIVAGKNKCIYDDDNQDYSQGVYKYYENEPHLTDIDGNNKLLYVLGNHDRNDATHSKIHLLDENGDEIDTGIASASGQLNKSHAWLRYLLGDSVNYGSANNCAYWYRDFAKTMEENGQTVSKYVRVIGIDNYENTSSVNPVCFTQAQVTWLLNLLASTPPDYYIMIIGHESPFKEPSGTGHTAAISMRPTTQEEANGQKLFVSENFSHFHERSGETNVNLLPIIMKAYLHQENLNTTYTNNESFGTVNLVKDFREVTPATFVGWLYGHIHSDNVGYVPHEDFNDQLLLGICASDSTTKWASTDDLLYDFTGSEGQGQQWASGEPTYRINELIIDFTVGTITIKRHGNKTTANVSGRSYGGRVRDEVTFNLRKEEQS